MTCSCGGTDETRAACDSRKCACIPNNNYGPFKLILAHSVNFPLLYFLNFFLPLVLCLVAMWSAVTCSGGSVDGRRAGCDRWNCPCTINPVSGAGTMHKRFDPDDISQKALYTRSKTRNLLDRIVRTCCFLLYMCCY